MVSTDRIKGLSSTLAVKAPVLAATTAPITLSGLQTIDGVAIPSGGRVLVKDQADPIENGWYDASTSSWSRSIDANGNNDLVNGTLCVVAGGTTNGAQIWKLSGTNRVTPGTSAMAFVSNLSFGAVSAFILTLFDDADAATARATLGAEAADVTILKDADIGVSVQAYDADIPTVSASQGEMEAGTEANLRSMSPLRVAQAIAALGGGGGSTEPTGVVKDYVGTTAPTGYVLLSGRTIGNAASGATERANADTSALFTLLWNSMADTEAAVSSGRGANAAADYAANKTITLPDARGRTIAGKDNMGGTTASRLTSGGAGIVGTTLGVAGGTQTHTLTTAQLASHGHNLYASSLVSNGSAANTYLAAQVQNSAPGASIWINSTDVTNTTAIGSAGSGSAHQNTQPTLVLNKIIKL